MNIQKRKERERQRVRGSAVDRPSLSHLLLFTAISDRFHSREIAQQLCYSVFSSVSLFDRAETLTKNKKRARTPHTIKYAIALIFIVY